MSDRQRRTGMAVWAVAVLVAGCGGGGGGSGGGGGGGFGNALPPSTGPGDVQAYFPHATGDSWSYLALSTASAGAQPVPFLDSITVSGVAAVGGVNASVFVESNPSNSGMSLEGYYYANAGGIAYLGTNDPTDTLTRALSPYIVATFPIGAGTVAQFSKNGVDFGADVDGDGIHETANLSLTSAVGGPQTLAIGAGQFPNTVTTVETITGTVILSKNQSSVPVSQTITRWSAPGIGIVKTTTSVSVQSLLSTEVDELRGYTVDGVAHGFDMPFTVGSALPAVALPVGDRPAVATDGQHLLAASTDASGLIASLLDGTGTLLASARLAAGAGSNFQLAGFDGTNYWVVYSPYSNVTSGSVTTCYAQRLSPAGGLLDAGARTLVSADAGFASIGSTGLAFGGGKGLLAFSEFNLATNQHELHGVLLNPDGTAGPAFAIATDDTTHLDPAVAFDGTNFLVAWYQLATAGATTGSIYAVRISTAGTILDATPLLIANPPTGATSPAVAFDGTNYLVVWLTGGAPGNGAPVAGVYGARVTTAGALLDGPTDPGGFAINTSSTLQLDAPRVAFTGAEYLVAWQLIGYAQQGSAGVQAARVALDGTLLSGANLSVGVSGAATIDSNYITGPAITAGTQSGAILWYETDAAGPTLHGAAFHPF